MIYRIRNSRLIKASKVKCNDLNLADKKLMIFQIYSQGFNGCINLLWWQN